MKHIVLLLIFIISTDSFSQLNGNYTIGSGGNYPTINDACSDLEALGVSGPVVFNIFDGVYNEQVILDSVSGTSTVNTVTFTSLSGIPENVIWKSLVEGHDYLLQINGADHIKFEKITFNDSISFIFNITSRTILVNNSCEGLSISGNIFTFDRVDATSFTLIQSNTVNGGSINISGNVFSGGFTLSGNLFGITQTAGAKYICITGNTFTNIWNTIRVTGCDSVLIEKNVINSSDFTLAGSSIIMTSCNGSFRISKNKIRSGAVMSHPACLSMQSCNTTRGLVSNNFIIGRGILSNSSKHIKYYYNSLTGGSFDNLFDFQNSDSNRIINNILVNLSGDFRTGYPYLASGSVLFSDYNDFEYVDGYFGSFNGTSIATLADWQNTTGYDAHSSDTPVVFFSPTDLHLAGSSIGNEALTGIPVPEVLDDIDDQPRNAQYPYMGADEADIVLPVELSSFSSSVERNNVTLNWSTSGEINNSGFEIQRSQVNGQSFDWIKAGYVTGSGTIQPPAHYTFTDRNLKDGRYAYRLKQTDLNGNFEYHNLSGEVIVSLPKTFILYQNYPNPFNPSTQFDLSLPEDMNVVVKIYDMSGKQISMPVNEYKKAGYYTIHFDGGNLSSGIYFYTVEAGQFNATKKMMLLK